MTDQLEYGMLTPIVDRVANDLISASHHWATQRGLLPGMVGHVILESAFMLAFVKSMQARLGLEPTMGDVADIISYAVRKIKEKPCDLAPVGDSGSSGHFSAN